MTDAFHSAAPQWALFSSASPIKLDSRYHMFESKKGSDRLQP